MNVKCLNVVKMEEIRVFQKFLALGSWIVQQLHRKHRQKVLTARAVIQGAGTWLSVEVMNPLEKDVILYKHSQVGIITRPPDPIVIQLLPLEEGSPRRA